MRKALVTVLCIVAAGCASEGNSARALHGAGALVVRPGNAAEVNTLRISGVDAAGPGAVTGTASMDDMPAKSPLTFVRDGDAYVARTQFAMAGKWRIHIASRRPADFTVVVK